MGKWDWPRRHATTRRGAATSRRTPTTACAGAILDGLSKMRWFNQVDYYRGKYEEMAHEVLYPEESRQMRTHRRDLEEDVRWLKNVGGAGDRVHLLPLQGRTSNGRPMPWKTKRRIAAGDAVETRGSRKAAPVGQLAAGRAAAC